jgi:hypothetical protein
VLKVILFFKKLVIVLEGLKASTFQGFRLFFLTRIWSELMIKRNVFWTLNGRLRKADRMEKTLNILRAKNRKLKNDF